MTQVLQAVPQEQSLENTYIESKKAAELPGKPPSA